MENAQIQGFRMMAETLSGPSVLAHTMTAREMALTSHNLSRSGDMATLADGSVYVWDKRFEHWALWKRAR
jgi:hypothetical protein